MTRMDSVERKKMPGRARGALKAVCLGLALGALAAVAGCQSYTIVQRNIFSDEDGFLTTFKSKLVVEVDLPDGESFKAWQCMNFQSRGTMYKTDNGRWQILVNGFTCIVYRQSEDDESAYRPVYRGVLCDTPHIDVKKDERWKPVAVQGREYRKPSR